MIQNWKLLFMSFLFVELRDEKHMTLCIIKSNIVTSKLLVHYQVDITFIVGCDLMVADVGEVHLVNISYFIKLYFLNPKI